MSAQISDDVFLSFLEAALFEDKQLGLGAAIDPSKVARTASLESGIVHECIQRLVAEDLGYLPKREPGGFQIEQERVSFELRKLERALSKRSAGATYNFNGITAGAISIGEGSSSSGSINHVGSGSSQPSQGAATPPAGIRAASSDSGAPATSEDAGIDFAILTAIEVERRAVCAAFGLTDKDRVKKDGRVYWRGRLTLPDGQTYEIVVAQPVDMGQVEAALLAAEVIRHWSPSAALLVGIAASTDPDKVRLGDVVVGKSVWYYEHGKVTEEGTKPQPEMLLADSGLLKHLVGLPDWDGSVLAARPDGTSERPKAHQGAIASGEKVIADAAVRDSIAAGHRKILALEMEGYGFSRAVWQSFERVRHLNIRGICDEASKDKTDGWHGYAAGAAAGFVKHFLLDRPLEPVVTRTAVTTTTPLPPEQTLQSSDLSDRQQPTSTAQAVTALKDCIANPLLRIRLEDLIRTETDRLYDEVSLLAPPGVMDESFALGLLGKYETICKRLSTLLLVGCYYGGQEHLRIWQAALERIVGIQKGYRGLGNYPALLLLYSACLGSILGDKYGTLQAVTVETTMPRMNGEVIHITARLNAGFVLQSEKAGKLLETFPAHTAISKRLAKVLRDAGREVIADAKAYDRAFDRMEYFLALTFLDQGHDEVPEQGGPPTGRFTEPYRNNDSDVPTIGSIVTKEYKRLGAAWPPLKAGMFRGSGDRFEKLAACVDKCAVEVDRW